jgi:hypothetical protein
MKLEILVGMIASGKSTYARKRADEGALVVSHDGLTEMLHACYRYEPELRDVYRRMEEALVDCAFRASRDVVIDRTHLTAESRNRWVSFYWNRFGYTNHEQHPIIAVAFPIESPETHAIRRTEHDSRGRSYGDWLKVAAHHHEQAMQEPLSDVEGFSEILYMTGA